MAIRTINTFQNCPSAVEEIRGEKGELEGYAFIIIDNDSGAIWRYPMPLDTARTHGQSMMGISAVAISNGSELEKLKREMPTKE